MKLLSLAFSHVGCLEQQCCLRLLSQVSSSKLRSAGCTDVVRGLTFDTDDTQSSPSHEDVSASEAAGSSAAPLAQRFLRSVSFSAHPQVLERKEAKQEAGAGAGAGTRQVPFDGSNLPDGITAIPVADPDDPSIIVMQVSEINNSLRAELVWDQRHCKPEVLCLTFSQVHSIICQTLISSAVFTAASQHEFGKAKPRCLCECADARMGKGAGRAPHCQLFQTRTSWVLLAGVSSLLAMQRCSRGPLHLMLQVCYHAPRTVTYYASLILTLKLSMLAGILTVQA